MNHLAHLLTAGQDEQVRLGVLFGDHVRGGDVVTRYPGMLGMGIQLHRAVDSYTDQHPELAVARNLFEAPFRRYAGILLDVYWDHLLSREWARYCQQPLLDFADDAMALLNAHFHQLPAGLQRFTRYARVTRVLARYGETEMLAQVYAGISQRLRHDNPVADGLAELQQHEQQLAATFDSFFPQLLSYAQQWREDSLGAAQPAQVS